MKVNTSNDTVVERSGLASDGSYGIIFNAKMAKILSDGLYSDKIQSIIRELSCNAVDSHVEAGKRDVPIEVHLPTMFEPWFHVRDFGMGLDHRQVVEIFTIYGASTKIHSDEFIGQLGLGSKSPFSYVDAYDVTAIKDGVERQYSMYKNEQGMPSVALLGERQTDEPNGVTIKMPARQTDFDRFKEKAAKVFRWFAVRPTITGVSSLEIKEVQTAFSGDGWTIRRRDSSYYASADANRPIALMGRVAYPIDSNAIEGLDRACKAILGTPLVIEFGIGDLEIAASREALGYDERTQKNVLVRIRQLLKELGQEFEKRMASATTEWEARQIFGDIFGNGGDFRYEFEQAYGNHGLSWNGKLIKEPHVVLKTTDIWQDKNNKPRLYGSYARYKRAHQQANHTDIAIRCTDRVTFVFNDLDKGGISRVNYLIETGSSNRDIWYFDDTGGKSQTEILDMLGNPPHVMASNLPKRPSTARTTKISMLRYQGNGNGTRCWTPVDVALEDGGLYVELDRWDVLRDGNKVEDLGEVINLARQIGIIAQDAIIYAPRGNLRKQVTESDDWVNIWDRVRNEVNRRLGPATLQVVADSIHYSAVASAARDPQLWRTNWHLRNPGQTFGLFVDAMRKLEANESRAQKDRSLIQLANHFGTKVQDAKPSVDAHALHLAVMGCYPMLGFVFADRYATRFIETRDTVNRITDYVNMVDDQHTLRAQAILDADMEMIVKTAA